MDEAANIAPVRNLAAWLSQCGDHGVVIATIWQSIAQIDQRYGRAARDAICAASTAQIFIPPLAEPTSAGYLTEMLGEEAVANASTSGLVRHTVRAGHQKAGPAPWLRQIPRGRAILIYRDLPPAIVRAPGMVRGSAVRLHVRLRAGRGLEAPTTPYLNRSVRGRNCSWLSASVCFVAFRACHAGVVCEGRGVT
jgi:hypothetical protein